MMRIGDAFRYQLYQTALSNLEGQLDNTAEEVASGKKVMVPSDDPASYAQNLEILAQQSQNTQYKNNLDSLQAQGSYYQTSVNSISNVLSSIQQLAIEMASSTVDANSRASAASQVDDLIQQLVTVGNTKVGDTYIFGGTMAANAPYTSNGTFQGSAEVGQVAVSSSTTVDAGISGQTIFTGTANGQAVDIFQTLQTFSQDLSSNNTAGLQTDLGNINNCVDLTANNLAYVGTYTKNISNLLTANSNTDTTLSEDSSDLVSADMAKAISDYSTLSTAYQAALYTMAKVESLNILDYLPA